MRGPDDVTRSIFSRQGDQLFHRFLHLIPGLAHFGGALEFEEQVQLVLHPFPVLFGSHHLLDAAGQGVDDLVRRSRGRPLNNSIATKGNPTFRKGIWVDQPGGHF